MHSTLCIHLDDILNSLMQALAILHANNYSHGDIKPGMGVRDGLWKYRIRQMLLARDLDAGI